MPPGYLHAYCPVSEVEARGLQQSQAVKTIDHVRTKVIAANLSRQNSLDTLLKTSELRTG
jgi:hypothetical protein